MRQPLLLLIFIVGKRSGRNELAGWPGFPRLDGGSFPLEAWGQYCRSIQPWATSTGL